MPPHAPTTSTGSGRHQAKTSTQTPRGHQKNKLSNSSTASSAGGGSYASESDVEEDFKRRPNRDSIASVQSNRTDVSTQTNGSGSVRETARSRNSWNARPPPGWRRNSRAANIQCRQLAQGSSGNLSRDRIETSDQRKSQNS